MKAQVAIRERPRKRPRTRDRRTEAGRAKDEGMTMETIAILGCERIFVLTPVLRSGIPTCNVDPIVKLTNFEGDHMRLYNYFSLAFDINRPEEEIKIKITTQRDKLTFERVDPRGNDEKRSL